ncbi:MAG: hypothetical protein IPK17_14055 [Chloroflexi bacterium]|uniref:hypothetical protein n=1 Tax=Candidatus Flexifilum breve TaxID=3140694 RepID=UPI003134B83C|nr:hypothetical protein [Chloroflexota bacterium]
MPSLELMKTYAASQWDIFRKLRLPTALPYIFSALKVGKDAGDDRRDCQNISAAR